MELIFGYGNHLITISICSSEVIHSPKYSYFKFIFIYSGIISQPSNYTAHNNPKSRISRLDWHVYLFYQWRFLRVRFEPATFQLQAINLTTELLNIAQFPKLPTLLPLFRIGRCHRSITTNLINS